MSKIHLRPDVGHLIRRQGSRLGRLEQRDGVVDAGPDPASVVFTIPGALVGISAPYVHPTGGLLVSARCTLKTADPTEEVEVVFARNGTPFDPVHSWSGSFDAAGTPVAGATVFDRCVIAAGETKAVAFFTGRRFAPDLDFLEVGVLSAGAGATHLTVRTDWA